MGMDSQDAELISTEYGINIFLFLNSDFHNWPEKWLMGFFCSWVCMFQTAELDLASKIILPGDILRQWFCCCNDALDKLEGPHTS